MGPEMVIASMVMSAAGAGISAYGSMKKGEAGANMYTYQAGVAQINHQIAKQNADYARWTGEVEAQASGMQTRAQVGQTKVVQSGRGLDIGFGTPSKVRESEVDIGQQNQMIIRSRAAKIAYGHEVDAISQTAKGQIARMSADNARAEGKLGAITSLLGGATSVASKWYQMGPAFGPGGGGGTQGSAAP